MSTESKQPDEWAMKAAVELEILIACGAFSTRSMAREIQRCYDERNDT